MAGVTYKSYNFVDKDPIIDKVRTLIQEAGVSHAYIERKSGVTSQTLRNWFERATRRPQFATINAVARSIGYELTLQEVCKPVARAVQAPVRGGKLRQRPQPAYRPHSIATH